MFTRGKAPGRGCGLRPCRNPARRVGPQAAAGSAAKGPEQPGCLESGAIRRVAAVRPVFRRVQLSYPLTPWCRGISFHVAGSSRQMDQAKSLTDAEEGLRVSQKQISVRQKTVEEVLNDAPLGSKIEVDQHVATEDDIDIVHQAHAEIVGQIEPAEGYVGADHWIHAELIAEWKKIFPLVNGRNIACAVLP